MKIIFQHLANYNRWANGRLYRAAFALSDRDYRLDVGAFFKSMHGTLNHLLLTDRMWLKRLTGDHPDKLDAIIHDNLKALAHARAAEDNRLINYVEALDESNLAKKISYSNSSGRMFDQPFFEVLLHVFNHQTHHRGQAHTILSILTKTEPPSLDLLAMQRGGQSPDLHALSAHDGLA